MDTWACIDISVQRGGVDRSIGGQISGGDGSNSPFSLFTFIGMTSSIHHHLSHGLIAGAFGKITFILGQVIVLGVKDKSSLAFCAALVVYKKLTFFLCQFGGVVFGICACKIGCSGVQFARWFKEHMTIMGFGTDFLSNSFKFSMPFSTISLEQCVKFF